MRLLTLGIVGILGATGAVGLSALISSIGASILVEEVKQSKKTFFKESIKTINTQVLVKSFNRALDEILNKYLHSAHSQSEESGVVSFIKGLKSAVNIQKVKRALSEVSKEAESKSAYVELLNHSNGFTLFAIQEDWLKNFGSFSVQFKEAFLPLVISNYEREIVSAANVPVWADYQNTLLKALKLEVADQRALLELNTKSSEEVGKILSNFISDYTDVNNSLLARYFSLEESICKLQDYIDGLLNRLGQGREILVLATQIEAKKEMLIKMEYHHLRELRLYTLEPTEANRHVISKLDEERLDLRISLEKDLIDLKDYSERVRWMERELNDIPETPRVMRAKFYFNQGDMEKAKLALNENEILLEFKTADSLASKNIKELLLLAKFQVAYEANETTLHEAKRIFELALSRRNTPEWQSEYGRFLHDYGSFEMAKEYYKLALKEYERVCKKDMQYLPDRADLLMRLGNVYSGESNFLEASLSFNQSASIWRELLEQSSDEDEILPKLGKVLTNLGNLHADNGKFRAAERYYNEALTIRRQLANSGDQSSKAELSITLNNVGVLKDKQGLCEEAGKLYHEALVIRRELSKSNEREYLSMVSGTLNNLGILHRGLGHYEKSLKYYQESLSIDIALAERFPTIYSSHLMGTYNNLGITARALQQFKLAEEYYNKAIKIGRRLAKRFPDRYLPELSHYLYNLAVLLADEMARTNECKDIVDEAEELALPYKHIYHIRRILSSIEQFKKELESL